MDWSICTPPFEFCLKVPAAGLIDGASGNLSGRLSLYGQARLVHGGQWTGIQHRHNVYKMVDAKYLSGTNHEID